MLISWYIVYRAFIPYYVGGKHVAERLRVVCLPTRYYNYTAFRTECQLKNGVLVLFKRAVFPPKPKGLGFQNRLFP